MNRWWKVPIGVPLTAAQQEKTVGLVMAWIARQTLVLREKRKTEKPLLRDRKEFAILLRHGTTIENTCQESPQEGASEARPRAAA